ncbi:amidophosphoribosyltransferase [Caminibacter pacificus]|uniref:Amidophosphoribosyltransferase n=1 Tax=Caminibacter pacificus TaxID=1424653 RepID=A0AAJ4RCX8_9BACT|nr:amidophosphoribosyltransferase [Caminibacter pacificus]QCI27766.1 amidophosphoribosyltransferase [Caminibacter pacificus]ROR40059.1 amidophosphoribosyltransferase [Caminibacter pacificus]
MCSVVGIYGNENASKLAFYSLFAMQHRGQEAAGISSSDGSHIHTIKDRGLVTQIFKEEHFKILKGHMAIGHTRYSTAGDDSILDAQPVFARYGLGEISIVHNGNLVNAREIREDLIKRGAIFQSNMDTENLIHLIAKNYEKNTLKERIIDAVKKIKGAFSLIILSRSKMFAIRDPFGFRPLSLGKIKSGGYIVASETCAFELVGAEYVRDIKPGEMVIFENDEIKSEMIFEPTPKQCIFEYIYFARPDSNVFGKNVYSIRKQMGRELAKELPVDADMVVPVPDSGVAAALGYSQESQIPFEMAIMRNHYVGRTFIEPTQEIRDLKVKMKLSPIKHKIEGKKLVVIDDSIVRGTTSRRIVRMLKEAGAKEVHMRIASPATTGPCYYGVDTPTKEELIASKMSVNEICKYIEADSLAYLSIEGMVRAVKDKKENYCFACFDGEYPIL